MFDKLYKQLLEVYIKTNQPLTRGPDIDFKGPIPGGFLGGGLPGINPSAQLPIKIKKKKKKIKKKA